jgi:hypothetical protein
MEWKWRRAMIALSNGLTVFGDPVLVVGLIALTFAFLETERAWTRSRRRRGFEPGAAAYLLDGLVLAGVVLVLVGISILFIGGLKSIAHLLGGVFDGEQVGLLIVGAVLAIGLALTLVRVARGRRAGRDTVRAAAVGAAPLGYQPAPTPAPAPAPGELAAEEDLPPLALLQERWQPTARAAANMPTSFLEIGQPQAAAAARSRFAFALSLLTLAFVALLVSGAILFRGQLISMLSGLDSSGGQVAAIGNDQGAAQPNMTVEQPAVNVSSADQPAAPAPAPANDTPGGTKRVKSDELNVRARPGVDQQVVVVLTKGVSVTVLTDMRLIDNAVWVKVRVGDQEGWVDQSLLE